MTEARTRSSQKCRRDTEQIENTERRHASCSVNIYCLYFNLTNSHIIFFFFLLHFAFSSFLYTLHPQFYFNLHTIVSLLRSSCTAVTMATFGKILEPLMRFLAACTADTCAWVNTRTHTHFSQSNTQIHRTVCVGVWIMVGVQKCKVQDQLWLTAKQIQR